MVDYITDVIRPCPLDLMTFDYLRVTSDNKYIVGVASRGRRLAVFKVSQQGNLRHFLQPTAATKMRSTNAHFTYNNNSHISIAPYLFTYLVCISAQTTILRLARASVKFLVRRKIMQGPKRYVPCPPAPQKKSKT